MTNCSKPPYKYVGGKTKLLPEILPLVPEFGCYFEPFFGGGALFHSLAPKEAVIGDTNYQLIITLRAIKNDPIELMKCLDCMHNTEEEYYRIRELDREDDYLTSRSLVVIAARFIYLNKTCFNGLHRVNKQGKFNVPWGKNPNATLYVRDNILECSKRLQNVSINYCSFSILGKEPPCDVIQVPVEGDFVYFDPPYIAVKEDSHVAYTSDGFTLHDHRNLKYLCDTLSQRRVKIMLSNSDTEYGRELYKDYNIKTVRCGRSINSNGSGRGKINELLIMNY